MHMPGRNIRGWCRFGSTIDRWLAVCRYDEAWNETCYILRLRERDPRSRGHHSWGLEYRGHHEWMQQMEYGVWYVIGTPKVITRPDRLLAERAASLDGNRQVA